MSTMTRADIARLLALAACYDQRTVGEADVAAWHAALDGTTFVECEAAILAHAKISRDRVVPADILGRIRDARRVQADRRAALSTGLTDPQAAEDARRRGIARVYAVMGWTRHPDREIALSVPCPVAWCGAASGVPCRRSTNRGGVREPRDLQTRAHPSRVDAARHAAEQDEGVTA